MAHFQPQRGVLVSLGRDRQALGVPNFSRKAALQANDCLDARVVMGTTQRGSGAVRS